MRRTARRHGPSQDKDYVLVLLFVKYISDRYAPLGSDGPAGLGEAARPCGPASPRWPAGPTSPCAPASACGPLRTDRRPVLAVTKGAWSLVALCSGRWCGKSPRSTKATVRRATTGHKDAVRRVFHRPRLLSFCYPIRRDRVERGGMDAGPRVRFRPENID